MFIARIHGAPLAVPLIEPFVIASGSLDATRAVRVEVELASDDERRATGHGEAAALPAVTGVDQGDVLVHTGVAAGRLIGERFWGHADLRALLDAAYPSDVVARAGAEIAILDAWAQLERLPLWALLGKDAAASAPPSGAFQLTTDVTIPIAAPAQMGERAAQWRQRGFQAFKVKVGRGIDEDSAALAAIADRAPGARVRLDGNQGQTPDEALRLLDHALVCGLDVELLEQPCAKDDLDGMAFVTARATARGCDVIADESVQGLDDVDRIALARAASGLNLKLMKHGGPVMAARIGRAAKRRSLKVMIGAMVETRLGLAASFHTARALGGVDYVDLDTAFLLQSDPFSGGYAVDGAVLTLSDRAGVGVAVR